MLLENGVEIRIIQKNEIPCIAKDAGELYVQAEWSSPEDDTASIVTALNNTYMTIGAFSGNEMIGMARALSDGVCDACIIDVTVRKDFRKKGIATAILDMILNELKARGISYIQCIGTPMAKKLYMKRGKIPEGYTPFLFQ